MALIDRKLINGSGQQWSARVGEGDEVGRPTFIVGAIGMAEVFPSPSALPLCLCASLPTLSNNGIPSSQLSPVPACHLALLPHAFPRGHVALTRTAREAL